MVQLLKIIDVLFSFSKNKCFCLYKDHKEATLNQKYPRNPFDITAGVRKM